jgi:tRNA-splicing ligase RtcB (3'-phosphate/5'-hydroxy nucleic acid ligase)
MEIQGHTLEKQSNCVFTIAPKDGMRVPVKLFTSERLLEAIKGDDSVRQACNVATLPGIQTASIAMSDMHQGYGYCIGGVAAFDMQEGVISPGGIGFDINCLPRGARILTEHGYTRPIESFETEFAEIEQPQGPYALRMRKASIALASLEMNEMTAREPACFMKRHHNSTLYKITTRLGYSVDVTGEHPILTNAGMCEAKHLQRGQRIAIVPFTGIAYEPVADRMLVREEDFTPAEREQLGARGLFPLTLSNPNVPLLAKLMGFLFGDGAVYMGGRSGHVNAYGEAEELEPIKRDIERLGFTAHIYSRTRDHAVPTRYGVVNFSATNSELHTNSRAFAKLLFALGYPQGIKTTTPFGVPAWIRTSPLWLKRLFLAGLFGAELSAPRTHTKTGFDCPTLSQSKNAVVRDSGRTYMIELMTMLDEFGVRTHKLLETEDYHNKHGKTLRLRLQISSDEDNLLRLYERIGYVYNRKRERLSQIAIRYIKEKQLLTAQRQEAAAQVHELKRRGIRLKEAQQLLVSPTINARFIERHYYAHATQRITLDFPSFRQFVTYCTKVIEQDGCQFDEISAITQEPYTGEVYDFNIPGTHNFVANSVIVSNCGVRLLATPLTADEVKPKVKELLDRLFANCPVGVGSEAHIKLLDEDYKDLMVRGAAWAVEHGFGNADDVLHCESQGCIPGADPAKTSPTAQARGRKQLGTVGAGNHFIEIQQVDEIFDAKTATAFGIGKKGTVMVMIHCGSRGFGHQVCTDYIRRMEEEQPALVATLADKNLIYAPLGSKLADDYFKAMNAAANYAFANRHVLGHFVRKSFEEVFGKEVADQIVTVYDICHNIAKKESHQVGTVEKEVMVHRKGATRAFPPGFAELPLEYRPFGQPVIIPGSMGTASYVLHGTKMAMQESFGSTAHGAGRLMSRFQANREFTVQGIKDQLAEKGVIIKAASFKGVTEEAPGAYKDVEEVIRVSHECGIAKKVARLTPIGVVKG